MEFFLMPQSLSVFGVAQYYALRSIPESTIMLGAVGILPCYNYSAHLEKRPERILPPFWNMVFEIQDFCLRGIKPFDVNVRMHDTGADHIKVFDATGWNDVPVHTPVVGVDLDTAFRKHGLFRVYARLPYPNVGGEGDQLHRGCFLVPDGNLVAAIYYCAFGPDSEQNCQDWMSTNCGRSAATKGGSDVPWPLYDREKSLG